MISQDLDSLTPHSILDIFQKRVGVATSILTKLSPMALMGSRVIKTSSICLFTIPNTVVNTMIMSRLIYPSTTAPCLVLTTLTFRKFGMKAQPNANKVGPLGQRAGFDIKENFLNVIRVDFFQDSAIWANIGVGQNAKDEKLKNLADARDRIQSINYQRIDLTRMEYEVYFYERPFFNTPYLFVAFVINNKAGPSYFSYLRPDGAYFEELAKRVNVTSFNKEEIYDAFVPIEGESNAKKSLGLPLFGK